MYDDLKDIAETIDTLNDDLIRQAVMSDDPKLGKWFSNNARQITRMKNELESYIAYYRSRNRY